MNKITYQEGFRIRASEVDFEQKATIPAICNLLQEVAGNHALELQFDITDLQKDELTWVLHRLTLKIDRFPEWRETITIKTWPSSGDGLRAFRDFLIQDSDDKIIGKCLSYWLILSMENRRPIRIPKEILAMAPKNIDHVLPVTDRDDIEITQADNMESFEVRKSDLDLNRHVNNVRYIEWALSCLNNNADINTIDISFLGESRLGDTVTAEVQQNDTSPPVFHHQIKRKSDEKILAKAYTR